MVRKSLLPSWVRVEPWLVPIASLPHELHGCSLHKTPGGRGTNPTMALTWLRQFHMARAHPFCTTTLFLPPAASSSPHSGSPTDLVLGVRQIWTIVRQIWSSLRCRPPCFAAPQGRSGWQLGGSSYRQGAAQPRVARRRGVWVDSGKVRWSSPCRNRCGTVQPNGGQGGSGFQ